MGWPKWYCLYLPMPVTFSSEKGEKEKSDKRREKEVRGVRRKEENVYEERKRKEKQ